jgi:hypothetical protein
VEILHQIRKIKGIQYKVKKKVIKEAIVLTARDFTSATMKSSQMDAKKVLLREG